MRRRCSWTVAVTALGALLAGCSSPTTPTTSAAAPPVTVTVPASPPAPPSSTSATSAPSGDGGRCTTADLTPGVTRPDGAASQQRVRIVWTNTSGRPCSMTGFGGADLVASPRSEDRYSLPRAQVPTTTVRLAPGDQAHSTITYLPASSGTPTPYPATKVLVTPPDETRSTLLDWPGGPVLRQDGATRPGTYIGPVQRGSS